MKILLVLVCLISSSVFGANIELGGFSDDLLRERAKELQIHNSYITSLIENTNHRQLGAKDYYSTMRLRENFDGFIVVFDEKYQAVKAVRYEYILSKTSSETLLKGGFTLSQSCNNALAENLGVEEVTLETLFPTSEKIENILYDSINALAEILGVEEVTLETLFPTSEKIKNVIYDSINEEIDSCFDILGFLYYASRLSLENKTSVFKILENIKDPVKH